MHTKDLIRALVGIDKIIAEEVFMEAETNAIIIKSRLPKRDRYRCGLCNRKSPKYDKGQGVRRWRCLDVGSTKIFVEAEAPRVCCKEHGITTQLYLGHGITRGSAKTLRSKIHGSASTVQGP